jgi:peptide/nickel transport system substrate-binding protein
MNALNRRRLLTSGAAAAIFAASGLGASAAPSRGGHLRLGLSGGTAADGFAAVQPFGTFMKVAGAGLVFDTLTEIAADGTLRGELATSWESADGAQVWVLRLRRGVAFHDGRPFTADDAVASLRRHTRPGARTPAAPLLADVIEIRRLSADSLKITLAAPNVDFPFLLSDPHLLMLPAREGRAALSAGVGTGLYRLDLFEPGRRLLADRVPGHWKDGDAGWFDSVELLSFPTRKDRIEGLVTGRVDLIDDPDPQTLATLDRLTRFKVTRRRGNGYIMAVPPAGLPAAEATALRQALVHGLPRAAMAETLLAGQGGPGGDTPIGPANLYATATVPDWDPDRARRILGNAGLVGLSIGLGVNPDPAMVRDLAAAGFATSSDSGAITLRRASGRATEDWAFTADPAPGLNWVAGDKSRARFDSYLRAARAASSSSVRAELFAEMQQLVASLGSVAVPLHADFVFAGSSRLAHGPTIGRTATLDDSRIAERWWFA